MKSLWQDIFFSTNHLETYAICTFSNKIYSNKRMGQNNKWKIFTPLLFFYTSNLSLVTSSTSCGGKKHVKTSPGEPTEVFPQPIFMLTPGNTMLPRVWIQWNQNPSIGKRPSQNQLSYNVIVIYDHWLMLSIQALIMLQRLHLLRARLSNYFFHYLRPCLYRLYLVISMISFHFQDFFICWWLMTQTQGNSVT